MELVLNITRRCNLRCTYCTVRKTEESMPADLAKKAIRDAFRFDTDNTLGFYGGEPLLEKELMFELIDYAASVLEGRNEPVIAITTNCLLLDEEVLDRLDGRKLVLGLSYDGPLQDVQRPSEERNSTEIVRRNISLAVEHHPESIVMCTVTPESSTRLEEIIEDIHGLGCRRISFNLDVTSRNWDLCGFEHSLEKAVDLSDRLGMEILQIANVRNIGSGGHCEKCRAPYDSTVVDTDGLLYPCLAFLGHKGMGVGNIDSGLDEDLCREFYNRTKIIPEECFTCENRMFCNPECICDRFHQTGQITGFDPVFCRLRCVISKMARTRP